MSNPSAQPVFTRGRARLLSQRALLLIGSLALVVGAFAVAGPAPAQANTARPRAAQQTAAGRRVNTAVEATAGPGANLLRNANGTVGDTSAQGWDAVTIPGWPIRSGLPTVVRYGARGFPKAATAPEKPGNLFVGGAGGTAARSCGAAPRPAPCQGTPPPPRSRSPRPGQPGPVPGRGRQSPPAHRLGRQHHRQHGHPGQRRHRQGRPAAQRRRLHLPDRDHYHRLDRSRPRALRRYRGADQPQDPPRLPPITVGGYPSGLAITA